jgi:hypothetical protein
MKKVITKKQKVKKTIKSISSKLGLVLEGTVFLAEYDAQGKIVAKIALDNDMVLQALSVMLSQASLTKKKKP